jgi:hypothetical protein
MEGKSTAAELSDLLLGLVSKIPLSNLVSNEYHVIQIEATVPSAGRSRSTGPSSLVAPRRSSSPSGSGSGRISPIAGASHTTTSSTSANGTTTPPTAQPTTQTTYEKTFTARLDGETSAYLQVRAEATGDFEKIEVQGVRLKDVVSSMQPQQEQNNRRKKNMILRASGVADLGASNDGIGDLGASSTSVGSSDSASAPTTMQMAFGPQNPDFLRARAQNAYRIVYKLRLRDVSSNFSVDVSSLDIETHTGGFSMLWNDKLREKHLHTDPRLQELKGNTTNLPLSTALSPDIDTIRTEVRSQCERERVCVCVCVCVC